MRTADIRLAGLNLALGRSALTDARLDSLAEWKRFEKADALIREAEDILLLALEHEGKKE